MQNDIEMILLKFLGYWIEVEYQFKGNLHYFHWGKLADQKHLVQIVIKLQNYAKHSLFLKTFTELFKTHWWKQAPAVVWRG